MNRLSAAEARKELAETLNRVAFGGSRVVIHRRGRDVAALVSMEDLELLQRLEDHLDVKAALAAEKAARDAGENPMLWDEAKRALGL